MPAEGFGFVPGFEYAPLLQDWDHFGRYSSEIFWPISPKNVAVTVSGFPPLLQAVGYRYRRSDELSKLLLSQILDSFTEGMAVPDRIICNLFGA